MLNSVQRERVSLSFSAGIATGGSFCDIVCPVETVNPGPLGDPWNTRAHQIVWETLNPETFREHLMKAGV